ncbi:exonuclease DPD1, chloroplastic/mitochondrial [Amaranthus tricolor]|uniref:exonuclease DPD1, chloroplastic/mitochondrial n=1 Tax=Amaranthus tricolor TaxID=29722 RepID=UPI0025902FD9|nr:exonuclease DPD1, chloroplastic/mitochondrial [Amaranthus tricolor]XP_057549891.1 exonuclease DPD1, chloroplastic/mitochondrial [Amaranthus tricolor]
MRTAPMYFSVLRVPKCRLYSLVTTWWEVFDTVGPTCKKGYSFTSLSSHVDKNARIGGSWSRRLITTASEGRRKNSLSSASIVRHNLSDKVVVATNADVTINKIDGHSYEKIQYADVRQLIAENKSLSNLATFIVFDLETTGLDRKSARVIEIALQDLQGGENSTFHTLVNPEHEVTNTQFHNITTSMVQRPGVPRMVELIPILLEFVRSRQKPGGYVVLVAHNGRGFDVPFLVHEFRRNDFEIPSNWYFLDTIPLSAQVMKSAGIKNGKALQTLREYYGIELVGSAHRAMSDVHSLSLVLQRLTFDLKLPISELVQRAFKADELTTGNAKKKPKETNKKKKT